MIPVTVVDYGSGNLHSVIKALRECGGAVELADGPQALASASRVVLPGVGAFGDAMRGMRDRGLAEAVRSYVARGGPLLGICLGMQMLFSESHEFGRHAGLDVVPGSVVPIPLEAGIKIPHVGWNRLYPAADWAGSSLHNTEVGTPVYFVHSLMAVPDRAEDRLADAIYGTSVIAAAVRRGRVEGLQFHPEKSGPTGLAMVAAFLRRPS
jgi:glutamine amidotransferase